MNKKSQLGSGNNNSYGFGKYGPQIAIKGFADKTRMHSNREYEKSRNKSGKQWRQTEYPANIQKNKLIFIQNSSFYIFYQIHIFKMMPNNIKRKKLKRHNHIFLFKYCIHFKKYIKYSVNFEK
ncbi:hypothetical protein EDEG_02192 [Edhazardia aedis USNM 41457]|uniref:Uncharacterized protein n=1 Tax=Edhazardia aedis (strain USNM 41457) TaxID=1003232 RepID=J9DPY8_EDHAE|nr:hypothetical protein EDEG_02192 [Edhazardia aedis USNM 41457]|eukprot:EJW03427.1 hypothetical protein EDEG_02192 [Edhazardia aedis USNM 41457]